MGKKDLLDLIDEDQNILGQETRDIIHRKGLLHREVHVLFYTPKKEIIFQHRSKNKDTFPDLLDATIGGHVESGQTYEEAAIKEAKEETGLDLDKSDLKFVRYIQRKISDPLKNVVNNRICAEFAYCYEGNPEDLLVEKGDGAGFELWPIENILTISKIQADRFIPLMLDPQMIEIYKNLATK